VESGFDQLLESGLVSDLNFEQEGVISAITPSFAVEITPHLSFGASLNLYRIDPLSSSRIESRTRARYSGDTENLVSTFSTSTTTGSFDLEGFLHLPPSGSIPFPLDLEVEDSGQLTPFTEEERDRGRNATVSEGVYEEINAFEDLRGYNATLGGLWTLARFLTLGASVDLPWTAEAEQRQTTRNQLTVYDAGRTRVLDRIETEESVRKDIEIEFPLYWALGALVRLSPHLFTTVDVSQTLWSDFSFQAEGDPRINPLDGTPHGEHPIDDTWAARAGVEYLLVFPRTEVPLRAGAGWEQRPALDEPDDYYNLSLGTGISFGEAPGRFFIDFAYIYTVADDVRGIVPEQSSLATDVVEHQGFVSIIKHF
jgi:long-subunit fatty acid transport protein